MRLMYNLLMRYGPWTEGFNSFSLDRVFEFTEPHLEAQFKPKAGLDLSALQEMPCLFAEESRGIDDQFAHVGRITSAKIVGREIQFEVIFERNIAPIPHGELIRLARNFQISTSGRGLTEFNRSHWAIKSADLFRILHIEIRQPVRAPSVFRLPAHPQVNPKLVSAMMPFGPSFMPVWKVIQQACISAGLACDRADNIWQNAAVIDDVVNLIDRSAVVVFDCSGKNPNVFYELGLAHAWGKEVIIITNNNADIPFDLRHIRYLEYSNDSHGLELLRSALAIRLSELIPA